MCVCVTLLGGPPPPSERWGTQAVGPPFRAKNVVSRQLKPYGNEWIILAVGDTTTGIWNCNESIILYGRRWDADTHTGRQTDRAGVQGANDAHFTCPVLIKAIF